MTGDIKTAFLVKNWPFWPIWWHLLLHKKIKMFGPKTAIFAPKEAFLGNYRLNRLIWCPVVWLLDGCGAQAALTIERQPLYNMSSVKIWNFLFSMYIYANQLEQ